MNKEEFLDILTREVEGYKAYLETANNEWIVKGFIDVDKNVYTITHDTKVVSKIIEILLIPKLDKFARNHGMQLELPSKQNFYPDLTFKDAEGHLFAVDFKTSYYEGDHVNGLTLGSYWGYFRDRNSVKNMDYTYNSYSSHIVLGILYKQSDKLIDKKSKYKVDELNLIESVINNFIFFVQPKWKIANVIPGSGNTRNIGGISNIKELVEGHGPFAELGETVFDDYWSGYYNKVDARTAGIGEPHYTNLESYKKYLQRQKKLLDKLK
uniref:Restriction endonuclease n=2 Tax=unclassified Prevotella TaxID=2638335 RepID=A0AB33J5J7_9BACT